ncbi:sporulation protein YabP [Aquibacillus sp. 3ASR75-11]|uniref:Sporulation protein YabP n=1 Tax=Terrihalobacillus insolitus TaxID=2950438 RepID=A0A9X4APX2_9BACI|nr:sporulation protein YabP [Terrihalobacillus insolitus]MDC3414859.1 sporulation protein YabP [Terrihalobacillus insolitus]MDC3426008.1 sporulation protein YabP [Terrihalobacillus insolitus]
MNYYEKDPAIRPQKEHLVTMNNRRGVEISGVKEVDSFDNEEFLLQTVMGYLIIRGENLQLKNLDLESGNVSIKGKIYELSYLDEQHAEKAKGFFSKLFK